MKIVVKHVDNLKSSLIKGKNTIPEYLVYTMTDDNIPITCANVVGDKWKDAAIKVQQLNYDFTLPVHEVSYNEFKNNVIRNEATYVEDKQTTSINSSVLSR